MTGDKNPEEGRETGPLHFPRRVVLLLLAVLLAAMAWHFIAREHVVVHSLEGFTMGSGWSVRVVAEPGLDALALKALIEARFQDLDQQLSGYRPGTGLSLLNAAKAGEWVALPPDLGIVLREGFALHRQTAGAFDMTVRPLVLLWGFGAAEPRQSPPADSEIAEVLRQIGSDKFEFSPDAQKIRRLGVATLDVDAIAPGHAADEIARLLDDAGMRNHLVEVGGELRASGRRPDGHGWRVGIERPVMARGDVAQVIEVSDAGVATSGDYRDYFEVAGVRYSHTLNPRTGRPVGHALASVTVIAPTTLAADGYATALTVMGPEQGMRFADEHGLAVFMILRDAAGNLSERYNARFAPYLGATP